MFITTVVIILITLLNVIVYKLLQLQESNSGDKLSVSSSSPLEQQSCRRFSLAEILLATNKFDESFVVGRGGFGKVYKGVVDNGAITVAIKRLNSMSKQGAPEFWTEIEMLSKFRHSHLVALIGYCDIYNEMILVYQFMVHGTLADHLHKFGRNDGDKSSLSWFQCLKICIGAARGLDYLHTGTGVKHRVIHRDVKSSNILLDENWAAKISDFGLSKIGPADQSCTHVSTYVKGTCGYMDLEYLLTRRLTRKSDVYSFGVVLFEVLCGRPAMDRSIHEDQRGLARWAKHCIKEGTVDQIIDPNLRGEILPSCLSTFVGIAGKCLHSLPKKRPTMTEVVGWLELALTLQEKIDSSRVEKGIFYDNGAYDIQEHSNSSLKREVTNADNSEYLDVKINYIKQLDGANGGQSPPIKPAKRMTFAKKVWGYFSVRPWAVPVRIGPKLSETVKGKLRLGAKILQLGGVEKVLNQKFSVREGEKLLKASQCYLSTTAGPIAGLLFIFTDKVAFCSDRPIKLSTPTGELLRYYYKVLLPIRKIRTANQSENLKNPSSSLPSSMSNGFVKSVPTEMSMLSEKLL